MFPYPLPDCYNRPFADRCVNCGLPLEGSHRSWYRGP
jgi:hypothetical protein